MQSLDAAARMFRSVRAVSRRARLKERVWERASRETVALQEMLRDIRTDFQKSLWRQVQAGDRVSALTTMECLVSFAEDFLPADSGLLAEVADRVCRDGTIFLSHKRLHSRWLKWASEEERRRWNEDLKRQFGKMSRAVTFLRGESSSKRFRDDAEAALSLSSMHQSPLCVKRIFEVLRSEEDVEDAVKYDVLLKVIASSEDSVRTDAHLALHSFIQDSIGVARFVQASCLSAESISFLFHQDGVLHSVIEAATNGDDSHVVQVSKETLAYLLKASPLVLPSSVCEMVWQGLVASLPLIATFAGEKSHLGRTVSHLFRAKESASVPLSALSVLQGNMRLLFCRCAEERREALVNLKMLLAKERGSHEKLPRYSSVIDSDIADIFVNVCKANLIVRRVPSKDDEEMSVDEMIRTMESLLPVKRASRASWARLELMMHDEAVVEKFVSLNGLQFMEDVANEVLKEENGPLGMSALPKWLSVVKLVLLNENAKRVASESEVLAFALLRLAFFPWEDPNLRSDLAAVWFMVLHGDYISVIDSKLYVHPVLRKSLCVPFECLSRGKSDCESESREEFPPEFDAIFKTFWNVAYFGGVERCLSADKAAGEAFSIRLRLTNSDRALIEESFAELVLAEGERRLVSAVGYKEFSLALHHLVLHAELARSEDDGAAPAGWSLPARFLSRFFVKRPRSGIDRQTLLSMLQFLSRILVLQTWPTDKLTLLLDYARDFAVFLLLVPQREDERQISPREVRVVSEFYQTLLKVSDVRHLFQTVPSEVSPISLAPEGVLNAMLKLSFPGNSGLLSKISAQDVSNMMTMLTTRARGSQKLKLQINVLVLLGEVLENGTDEEHEHLVLEVEKNFPTLLELWEDERSNCVLRTLAMEVTSELAQFKRGAATLVVHPHLWLSLLHAAFHGPGSSAEFRRAALHVMCALLDVSDNVDWFGPVVVETITRLVIAGEGGLKAFVDHNQVFEALEALFNSCKCCSAGPLCSSNSGQECTDSELATKTSGGHKEVLLLTAALEFLLRLVEAGVEDPLTRNILASAVTRLESISNREEVNEVWMRYLATLLDVASLVSSKDAAGECASFLASKTSLLTSLLVFFLERSGRRLDAAPQSELARSGCNFVSQMLAPRRRSRKLDAALADLVSKNAARLVAILIDADSMDEGLDSDFLLLVRAMSMQARKEMTCADRKPLLAKRLERPGIDAEKALGAVVAERIARHLLLWPDLETAKQTLALAALKSLFLVSTEAQVTALDMQVEEKCESRLRRLLSRGNPFPKDLTEAGDLLGLLANLCHRNTLAKQALAEGTLPDLVLRLLAYWGSRTFPRSALLCLLMSASTHCHAFREALCRVRPAREDRQQLPYGQPVSVLQFLLERSRLDAEGDFLLCSRLLMILVLHPEGRRLVCRSGLLQDLLGKMRANREGQKFEITFLDLLLSITAFPDGQMLAHQVQDLERYLCDLSVSRKENKDTRTSSAALATLRNMAMCTAVSRKLLVSPGVVDQALLAGLSSGSHEKVRIALQLTWAMLAHSTAKARSALKESKVADVVVSSQMERRCRDSVHCRTLLSTVTAIFNM